VRAYTVGDNAIAQFTFQGIAMSSQNLPPEPNPAGENRVQATEHAVKNFARSHFGNPDAGEVYGQGNDYETEEEEIKKEKASANQAIWYTGAFGLLLLLGYLFFG
jgi:hypothetical protein